MPQDNFSSFVNVLRTEVEIQAFKYTEEVAKSIAEEAVEILDEQRYAWQPLNDAYLEGKIKVGRDPRILIATGFYQDHITWGKRADGTVWVGVEDIMHPDADISLIVLARIHEFGTATIPARPLWRPLLSKYVRRTPQFARKYQKEVEKATLRIIQQKKLNKRTVIKAKR